MRNKAHRLLVIVILATALLGLALSPVQHWTAQASPQPVRVEVTTLNSSVITSSTNFGGNRWSPLGVDDPPTVAEIFLFIDIDDSNVNTTTFTLQVSPDGSTWVNHSSAGTLASAVVADTNTYSRTTIEGLYYRVVAAPTNNQQITPTIKVVER